MTGIDEQGARALDRFARGPWCGNHLHGGNEIR